jgi:hypothetical protein
VAAIANGPHLLLSPGKTIDPEVIATFIAGLTQRFKIKGLAYDRWGMQALLKEFDRIGLQAYEDKGETGGDGLRLVPWGQGYRDMGPAVNALETAEHADWSKAALQTWRDGLDDEGAGIPYTNAQTPRGRGLSGMRSTKGSSNATKLRNSFPSPN